MVQKLPLLSAAQLLCSLTDQPHRKDDVVGIIMAGADGHFPVYWLKPKFLTTILSNFTTDWKHTDSLSDWLQIQPHDLHDLARTSQTDVISFELSTEDKKTLKEILTLSVDLKWPMRYELDRSFHIEYLRALLHANSLTACYGHKGVWMTISS